jgi:hypothetical protein
MADQVSSENGYLINGGQIGEPPGVPVAALPSPKQVYSQAQQEAPYDQFLIDTIYRIDSGYRVIAKAGTNASATTMNSLVLIHRGTCVKEVRWTTQRYNVKPLIPKWKTGDPNEIPLTQEMNFCNVAEAGEQGRLYRASGVYTYAMIVPKSGDSKFPIGTTPAEIAPSSTRWYGPEDFTQTILDSAFATPGVPVPNAPVPRVGI